MTLLITNDYIKPSERTNIAPTSDNLWIFENSKLVGCYGDGLCSLCSLRTSTHDIHRCNESAVSLIYDIYKRSNQKEFIFTFDESTHPEFFI